MDPITDLQQQIAAHKQSSRPFVTLSYAQSLDGSIALNPAKSLAISGTESLELTHRLRAEHDAILVGVGTILADNPSLTVRLAEGRHPQPIVLDSLLTIPDNAQLFKNPRGLIIATTKDAPASRVRKLTERGITILPLSSFTGKVDLEKLLAILPSMGIHSVMVEGGAQVLTTFLRQKFANWALVTIAPYFVGGLSAITAPPITEPSAAKISAFPKLTEWQSQIFGQDLVLWGTIK